MSFFLKGSRDQAFKKKGRKKAKERFEGRQTHGKRN